MTIISLLLITYLVDLGVESGVIKSEEVNVGETLTQDLTAIHTVSTKR